VDLRTRHAVATAEENVLAMLYARLVNDALNAYAYPARLAGLSYGLGPTDDGLSLSLGGFDDRLDVLLERVLATMTDLEARPERFEHFRSELLRDLRNTRQDRPYQQVMAELRRLLETGEFPLEDLIAAAEAADREALLAWMPRALGAPRTVALFHGNLTRRRALELADALAEGVAAPDAPGATLDPALVRLPEAGAVQRRVDVDHPDAALALYVQGREQSWAERARYGLLAHMLTTPYFNALRTERQFGYVVSAGAWVRMNTPGLYFVVQSPKVPPAVIVEATGEFLDAFGTRLGELTEAEFETERQGLLSRLLERDENLGERSSRLWRDLDGRITSFDSRERIADAVRTLELPEFRRFYAAFRAQAAQSHAMAWTPGRFPLPEAAPAGTAIEDVAAFKATRATWTAAGAVTADTGAAGGR
jgi:secreted Zn-dependent insulinase-like peptidase